MNIKKKIWIVCLLIFGVCMANAVADDEKMVVFEKFVEPTVTGSTYLDVNGEASISIAVLVNDEGYVDDWITLRTNDKKLINSVANVIEKWKFVPPTMDGEPSWSYSELNIRFKQSGAVVSLTPYEAVLTMFNLMKDDFQMVVPFSELDSIPKPIEMETPALHTSLSAKNSGKTVKFQFFIDRDGNVRMPIVKESSTENLVTAILLESLLKWKFEPPKHNGYPVATKAIIPFNVK